MEEEEALQMDNNRETILRILSVILDMDNENPVFALITRGINDNTQIDFGSKVNAIRSIIHGQHEVKSVFG